MPAVSGGINTSNFDRSLDVAIEEWFLDEFKQLAPSASRIAQMKTTSRESFPVADSTGLGLMQKFNEGDAINEDRPIQAFKTNYVVDDYGLIVPITHNAIRGDQQDVNQIEDISRQMARSFVRTVDKNAYSMLINGFDTNFTSYGDTKPLFSTSHTRADGGTAQSNASSTGQPLSSDGLEAGIVSIRNSLDHRGQAVDSNQRLTLTVPYELEKKAIELTDSELSPEDANNAVNVHNGRFFRGGTGIDVFSTPYVGANQGGSATNWFLTSQVNSPLQFYTREDFQTATKEDFETKTLKSRGTVSFAFGWNNPVTVSYASKGDGAAYSS